MNVLYDIINDRVKTRYPIGGMPFGQILNLWFMEAHKLREEMLVAKLPMTAHHIAGMIIHERNILPNDLREAMDKANTLLAGER